MTRPAVMLLSVLLGCPLPGYARDSSMGRGEPRPLSGSLSVGPYFPVLDSIGAPFLHEFTAELVFDDRAALGGKIVYFPDSWELPCRVLFAPSVRLRLQRSRVAASYVALAIGPFAESIWVTMLGLGYERTLGDRVRLFGEVGAFAMGGEEGGGGLPYLHVGVRFRL